MRAILDGVKVDWSGLLLNRLKEEKLRFVLVGDEWTANSVASLFNKITVIMEDYHVAADWNVGDRKYTKQKGFLTNNERIGGLPDSDNERIGGPPDSDKLGATEVDRGSCCKETSSYSTGSCSRGSCSLGSFSRGDT